MCRPLRDSNFLLRDRGLPSPATDYFVATRLTIGDPLRFFELLAKAWGGMDGSANAPNL